MRHLPKPEKADPNLLVGLDSPDDAGVYKLTDDIALVQTVDYFTPIVDDPYMFGQIAAANALSDVYAMGGKPLTVLNIVGFPIQKLDPSILANILKGAGDKVQEAGALIVGGHSIDDQEPKFGLAVTGTVHPEKVWTNHGARPGDVLILTKPIGVGILTTAIKRDMLDQERIDLVTRLMAELNKTAAETLMNYSIHACTDITGFGLLGHAEEMASGSNVGIRIHKDKVPVLPGAYELAEQGIVPGGSKANHRWLAESVRYGTIPEHEQWLLCDAITSGGLLVSIPAEEAEACIADLKQRGIEYASVIGEVIEEPPGCIVIEA
ncbi:selenide, water dikinase SelD [Ammoniphilus oxalaticus]|uniref:Selenide, water dikinase n=1 Tax=Ammoniphilus oxalaticus TaxID=66863 RepID=A0A419SG33_9BACL|nr:selenide, water dikinase SelD [Ammoniphilus oxalaticus]